MDIKITQTPAYYKPRVRAPQGLRKHWRDLKATGNRPKAQAERTAWERAQG